MQSAAEGCIGSAVLGSYPKLGVQHGEVAALLPWEAVAAPAENTALDPPTQENPVQIPQPGG